MVTVLIDAASDNMLQKSWMPKIHCLFYTLLVQPENQRWYIPQQDIWFTPPILLKNVFNYEEQTIYSAVYCEWLAE
jgi:hypothetical protein